MHEQELDRVAATIRAIVCVSNIRARLVLHQVRAVMKGLGRIRGTPSLFAEDFLYVSPAEDTH